MTMHTQRATRGWAGMVASLSVIIILTSCTHAPKQPAQETIPDNEPQVIEDIKALLITQLKKQYHPPDTTLRDTHPKSNGCVRGQFHIDPNIPAKYQQGIFQKGRSYPAWMRFSNAAPEITPDEKDDFRGLAIKLFDVEGERLPVPGDEQHTQDFLFIAHDAFFAGNPQDFHDFFDALFNQGSLGVAGYFLTHPRAFVNTLQGRNQFANPLDITWFSVAPFLLGPDVADGGGLAVKYQVRSCPNQPVQSIPDNPSDDYLEEAMTESLAQGDWCLEFRIQDQTDPQTMPIEDTLTAWDTEKAPFTKVATITLPQQELTSDEQKLFCENLSFNPWHGLTDHKPLGGINRARRDVMKALSDFRLQQRGVPRTEPTGSERF